MTLKADYDLLLRNYEYFLFFFNVSYIFKDPKAIKSKNFVCTVVVFVAESVHARVRNALGNASPSITGACFVKMSVKGEPILTTKIASVKS